MVAKVSAKTNNIKTTISVNRPSWKDMNKHYKTISAKEFYPIVSKKWEKLVEADANTWMNTCAGRMSYALNHSKFFLPKNFAGSFIGDNDGYNHWFRVTELKNYLKKKFGKGDFEYELEIFNKPGHIKFSDPIFKERVSKVKAGILDKITGKTGIVVFEVSGWNNATGHFTLWDGYNLLYAPEHDDNSTTNYYFWFVNSYAQTKKIIFWELK